MLSYLSLLCSGTLHSVGYILTFLPCRGKTTRPLSYDLNQIPGNYTVEVTNRFKRLDLLDRVPEELWMEVCNIEQEEVTKTIPKKSVGSLNNNFPRKILY